MSEKIMSALRRGDADSEAAPLVLVADDDPTIREFSRIALENAGFRVEDVEDGTAALEAFDKLNPDLMLLDVMMPGLDGYEVCAEIRARPGGFHFPIVMVTGLGDTNSIDKAYDAGATDFITKPINPDILGYRARYVLRSSCAEAEVSAAHALLTDAIESNLSEFRLFDAQDRLVMVNSRATDSLPELGELLVEGATYLDFLQGIAAGGLVPGAARDPAAWVADRLERHKNPPSTTEVQRSDGSWMTIFERRTSAGGTVSVSLDITDLKEREFALETAKLRAESADRAKSEFLAIMSHELRTPLNAIIGFAELMEMQTLGPIGHPEYLEYIGDIASSGQRLLKVISDILDMAKLSVGELTLDETIIDIRDALGSCLNLLETQAQEAGLTVTTSVPPDLPALCGDPTLLKKMILNVLSNAIKFSHPGGCIEIIAESEPAAGLTVGIQDSGIGMAEEDIAKVLEPFGQADSALSRAYEGTGLGLPLTKAMMELHGGALQINTIEGSGTYVSLVFPASRVSQFQADTRVSPGPAVMAK